jgi:CrcB protein
MASHFITDSLAVAGGAAIGANARYWLGYWIVGRGHAGFPWHTLLINVTGSLALGAIMAVALAKGWGHGWRLFAAVGVCGGYTTFSTFSAEVVQLFEEGKLAGALSYVALTNVICIVACLAGVHLARLAVLDGSA